MTAPEPLAVPPGAAGPPLVLQVRWTTRRLLAGVVSQLGTGTRVLLVAVVVLLLLRGLLLGFSVLWLVPLLVLGLTALAVVLQVVRAARRGPLTGTWCLDAVGFTITTPGAQVRVAWSSVTRIRATRAVVLLRTPGPVQLPRADLAPGDLQRIADLARAGGVQDVRGLAPRR